MITTSYSIIVQHFVINLPVTPSKPQVKQWLRPYSSFTKVV